MLLSSGGPGKAATACLQMRPAPERNHRRLAAVIALTDQSSWTGRRASHPQRSLLIRRARASGQAGRSKPCAAQGRSTGHLERPIGGTAAGVAVVTRRRREARAQPTASSSVCSRQCFDLRQRLHAPGLCWASSRRGRSLLLPRRPCGCRIRAASPTRWWDAIEPHQAWGRQPIGGPARPRLPAGKPSRGAKGPELQDQAHIGAVRPHGRQATVGHPSTAGGAAENAPGQQSGSPDPYRAVIKRWPPPSARAGPAQASTERRVRA